MDKIKADDVYYNEDRWILKLPYSAGGQHRGNKITYKTCVGIDDLLAKLRTFTRHPSVLGYIPYVLIQPRIRSNAEAKVSSIFKTCDKRLPCIVINNDFKVLYLQGCVL